MTFIQVSPLINSLNICIAHPVGAGEKIKGQGHKVRPVLCPEVIIVPSTTAKLNL